MSVRGSEKYTYGLFVIYTSEYLSETFFNSSAKPFLMSFGETISNPSPYRQRGIRVIILNIPTTAMNIDSENSWVLETVTNILIEVLGSIAEEERLKIRRRQAEGILQAKNKGVKFGRRSIRKPNNWDTVIAELKSGNISAVEAMKRLKLKKTTFYKLMREENNNE